MLLESGVEPPGSLTDVDLATATLDLVHNAGLFALRQHILQPGEDGAECKARSEHYPQVEPRADPSDPSLVPAM